MILSNTSLVAEFQHYFHDFVLYSSVNKNQIPMPVDIKIEYLTSQSVVELLWSQTFPYNTYYYLYTETEIASWPTFVRQRLMVYPSSRFLVPNELEGDNIFNLQIYDFLMLDMLLKYRHDSSSIILIESTSLIDITIDSTTNITTITGNINELDTPLSKLIFLYLDLHINNNYLGYYNIPNIISDCSMLATCFEIKLIDDYFNFMTNRESSLNIVC